MVCDLERRRIVTLLPDREIATVQAWLTDHQDIGIIARDRGGGYGEAAAKALPRAIHVADRWSLMENASSAFLDAVPEIDAFDPCRDRRHQSIRTCSLAPKSCNRASCGARRPTP
ncbi:hypothetical protein EN833_33885 [Mesorhizobium sp. M4B.F.Ca.ET.190.01.1.1]|nr:hypothetical protein EOA29_29105 [Mesorhizobium sp. M1E.F.Ca.ET.063.01.1.1]RWF34242.1 MAG: hypothetical protein EOS65_31335 [Mesorhizobium sp.]TGQ98928.1 hypothetical protein EN843_33880 [Mesorhizobium sp. M4B.F.Ca.ET.200.01.1.1]TGS11351.1 hypothetical protein EN833_33885 [Mesorhizobium sp. M4B.F.Ca.ET.190.01.1.1]TGT23704.1 hypothetical protein EN815_33870 [Mesorhizobium sp. M4B.F.Ca.ET.172.01.1.1]